MIREELLKGYEGDNAVAKVCQNIILSAIAKSTLNRKVTIKGGVVMCHKTNNVRRATQDLDIDFLKYSLSNESINIFIRKLNCPDGIQIRKTRKIEELKQQDYKGKRVYIEIHDSFGNKVESKIDFGVHNRLNIEQEEYCFDIAHDEEGVSLLINSNEQMFAEKLRSLLRFGPFSTRAKDIFDLYYLKDHVEIEKLRAMLGEYIYDDKKMRESQGEDIVSRLSKTFRDKTFVNSLKNSDKKWIDEDVEAVLDEIMEFIRKL